jgi:hypothetical protein
MGRESLRAYRQVMTVRNASEVIKVPPVGSIGYTGTYREYPVDIVSVSVVSVLEARGPE